MHPNIPLLLLLASLVIAGTNAMTANQQPTLKLYYFNIQGKGESIRLLAAYAGLKMEDYRFTDRDQFLSLKQDGTLPFGQVPLLEVDSKHKIPQSATILRYLSKLGNLYPEDPILAAKVDAALDQEADAFTGATVVSYTTRFGIPLDEAHVAAATSMIGSEIMPKHLQHVEKLLASSPTGWIAGTENPSAADFAWGCRLAQYIPFKDRMFDEKLRKLEDYPACKTLVDKLMGLPAIKEYYANCDAKGA